MEEIIVAEPTMTVYLDSEFRCHTSPAEGLIPFETSFFNGRPALIDSYRAVPSGMSWTREDGTVFYGEMFAPFKA